MNNIFNEYGRKARLFPALLCAIPFLALKHFLIDPYFGVSLTNKLFTVVIGDVSLIAVLMYLLSQINRLVSKTLFEDKSKFPTTEMLLPSSQDVSTEFRQKIGKKVNADFQLSLPNLADEQSSVENTKTRIKEIVHLIINKVGSGRLLLQHNIEYGFARNLIGGSVVAFIVALGCNIIFGFIFENKTAYLISTILSICYLIPVIFSKAILDHYSKEYARILFREYLGS